MRKITTSEFEALLYCSASPIIEKVIKQKRKFSQLLYDHNMKLIATRTITHNGTVCKTV
jgi:hypothetical protein